MSRELKKYRRNCFKVIRELLVEKPQEVVDEYIQRAKNTKNDIQLSQVLADVREII